MASATAYSAGSPGWETVVSAKTKNSKNGGKNAAVNAAKKKFVEKGPKLEDVLPMEQVASFYAFDSQHKQNGVQQNQSPKIKKDIEDSKNKKVSSKNVKKLKMESSNVSTKPKTLEEAVKLFNINEFKTTVAQVKNQYPDNFMLWLRDAALYLNVSLTTENPNIELEEPLNPFSQRPVSVITKETKKILIQLLEECGDFSRQSGYETLLANMGHDLAKGFSVHGYMVLLQLMSEGMCKCSMASINFHEFYRIRINQVNPSYQLNFYYSICFQCILLWRRYKQSDSQNSSNLTRTEQMLEQHYSGRWVNAEGKIYHLV